MDKSIGDEQTVGGAGTGEYTLSDGQVLGQYRILKRLGKGGMGEVYLAENTMMRKQVALKLLPKSATGGTFVDRFRIEARVMADLNHPNIVQVHHAGEENGQYYLTMDYICSPSGEPQTLEEVLEEKGRLSEGEVKEIALQICDALELAHGKGLVHRDLKPANILLAQNIADANNQSLITNNCQIKICDFGLAKVVGDDYLRTMIDRSINLSMAGELSLGDEPTAGGDNDKKRSSARAILGTYDYMAPEQKAGGEISPQTDLYAVGIILYRLLTGEKPEGMFEMPSEFGCDAAWDGIVRTCMQKKPERRPESAAALRGMAKAVVVRVKGEDVTAKERKERKKGNLKKKVLLGVVGVGVVAGAIGLGSLWGSKQEPEPQIVEKAVTPKPKPAPKKKVEKKVEPIKKASGLVEGKKWTAQLGSGVEMEFMPIAAGSFHMGSNSGDADEKPVHTVRLSKSFWMAKTEVTIGQWKRFLEETGHTSGTDFADSDCPLKKSGNSYSLSQNKFGTDWNQPMVEIDWNASVEFCKWLTKKERQEGRLPDGFEYALPTEAQWEYACRAGTTGKYAGNLDSMAWYSENSGSKTHPAGTKTANAWGLYDMHGNVWEWCLDDWHGSYVGAPSNGSRWGDGSGSRRVDRGGSWYDSSSRCRSAYRYGYSPDGTRNYLGFRPLVLER